MTYRQPSRRRLEVTLPQIRIRRVGTPPAPAPTSGFGGTGTPRHSVRCEDALWGAAVNRAAAMGVPGGLSGLVRGWLRAFVAGRLGPADEPDGQPDA